MSNQTSQPLSNPSKPGVKTPLENAPRVQLLSRRNFLGISFFGALAVLFGEAGVALLNFLRPVPSSTFGGLVYAGKVEEFAINSVSHIQGARCYISRLDNGMIALWQKCTHLGCAVPWVEAENQFHCPCHGSLFDNVGVVKGGPAPRPLDTFAITIKNGEVWVDTGKPSQRTHFDPQQLTGV